MGRRKILIEKIKDDKGRQVTFLKRKKGLVKKARELAVLCDCDIEVVIFGNNGQLYEFSSRSPETILQRYANYKGPAEQWNMNEVDKGQKVEIDMPSSVVAEAAGAASGAAARLRAPSGNISTEEEEEDSCSDNEDLSNKKGSASGSGKTKAEAEDVAAPKDMRKQAAAWAGTPGPQARDQSGPIPSVSSTFSNVTRGILSSDILRNQTGLPSPSQLTQSSNGEGSSRGRFKPAHLTVQIPERNNAQDAAPSSTGLSSIRAGANWNWSGSWTPTPQPTFTSANIDNAVGRESMYLMSPHGFPTVLPSPSAALVSARGITAGSLLGKRMADTTLMSANVTTPRKLQEYQI